MSCQFSLRRKKNSGRKKNILWFCARIVLHSTCFVGAEKWKTYIYIFIWLCVWAVRPATRFDYRKKKISYILWSVVRIWGMGLECAPKYSMRKNCFDCRSHSIYSQQILWWNKYSEIVRHRCERTDPGERNRWNDSRLKPGEYLYKRNGRCFLPTKKIAAFFECAGKRGKKKFFNYNFAHIVIDD